MDDGKCGCECVLSKYQSTCPLVVTFVLCVFLFLLSLLCRRWSVGRHQTAHCSKGTREVGVEKKPSLTHREGETTHDTPPTTQALTVYCVIV